MANVITAKRKDILSKTNPDQGLMAQRRVVVKKTRKAANSKALATIVRNTGTRKPTVGS